MRAGCRLLQRKSTRLPQQFSANFDPVLLTGETGTGKKFLSKQIHQQSGLADGPYIEIDLRDMNDDTGPERLFGAPIGSLPYGTAP